MGPKSPQYLKDELDILTEVGTTCVSHGSTALSEILGKRIDIQMPSVRIVKNNAEIDILEAGKNVTGVLSHLLTGLKGNVMVIFDEKSSFQLIDLTITSPVESNRSGDLTEIGISGIKEVGHVIISSYINALGLILNRLIICSVPTLINGGLRDIVNMAAFSCETDDKSILLIEAVFEEHQHKIKGSFYLLLNHDAVKDIQKICKDSLKKQ
ncbi:MAG: chemotaxis protein CheC [Candidatus Omnitrophota bacterium]|jgi:chemotaxis protein CheC